MKANNQHYRDNFSLSSSSSRHLQESSSSSLTSNNNNNNNNIKCHTFPLTVPDDPTIQHATQIVIAHRGASSHLPEHTLAGYRLALELGADYIEPDLVATKDRELIAIHSLDLSKTTNVDDVFGQDRMTSSKYMNNQMGYWAYDFTLSEIKQLRLRQRLPQARSTIYDNLFEIPTLTEILQLLIDWNENIQPQFYNLQSASSKNVSSTLSSYNKLEYPPPPRGIYAELKDYPWLLEDTDGGIDLVDLFFGHMNNNADLWKQSILQYMCDTKLVKEHQYKLSPLILQSFEATVIQNFTLRWKDMATNGVSSSSLLTSEVADPENPSSTLSLPIPVPPTILLISKENCQTEDFWFEMDDKYRQYIQGIGIDKQCFFIDEGNDGILEYQPIIMEKAHKSNWVVHPWTERPESDFFVSAKQEENRRYERRRYLNETIDHNSTTTTSTTVSSSPFSSVMEELMFFKCKVGIHGIFSESVDTAVRAMNMNCPDQGAANDSDNNEGETTGNDAGTSDGLSPSSACPTNNSNAINSKNIPLGPAILFSFFLGIFAALFVWKICCSRIPGRRWKRSNTNTTNNVDAELGTDENGDNDEQSNGNGIMMTKTNSRIRRGRQQHHSALATSEDEADHDLTLTPDDHEML